METQFLTLDEAAEVARTSPSTVRHWIRVGKLDAHRPGRRVLVERSVLVAFLRGDRSPRRSRQKDVE
ncbi:MAG: hypothetical protein CMN31_10615 [Sandaracinus sp.]|nr:hypothetical protein [Sandaracinus sp.]MBJ71775.1 hypothetical protein [Sandaracinus sp.]